MGRLKVTLVVPNFRWCNWDINTLWHYFPYNLCLLAAMIEDRCDVTILDAHQSDMDEDEFKSSIRRINPDIVGITVLMDRYADSGHNAAKYVKSVNTGIKVVMGGVYATLNPDQAIADNNIDFSVIGEGEYVFSDLIDYFLGKGHLPIRGICYRDDKKVINRGHADFIKDLDAIPMPAYHLIEFEKYAVSAHRKSVDSPREYPYARVLTSRGCPFGCVFCQVESISGKSFRARSAKNILDEIDFLKNKYKVSSIIFDDDNLFYDKKRAADIFEGMIKRKLIMPWVAIAVAVFKLDKELVKLIKASGCEYIDIAIESGSERVLREVIRKPINLVHAKEMVRLARAEGIYVAANFIVGFPTETWDEIRETIKFAEDINVDYAKIFTAIPLRNTRLWDLCEKEKVFKRGFRESSVKWSAGQIETDHFKADDLTILRAFEWDRINFTDPKKRKKTAGMMGISEEELYRIRKSTLENTKQIIIEGN